MYRTCSCGEIMDIETKEDHEYKILCDRCDRGEGVRVAHLEGRVGVLTQRLEGLTKRIIQLEAGHKVIAGAVCGG